MPRRVIAAAAIAAVPAMLSMVVASADVVVVTPGVTTSAGSCLSGGNITVYGRNGLVSVGGFQFGGLQNCV